MMTDASGHLFAAALAALLLAPVPSEAQAFVVVQSRGPGAWGAQLRLVEELTIGQLEGSEDYTFGLLAGVAVGTDGTIVVADRQPPLLRAYDASGRFVRRIGRPGQGPGEYAQIDGIEAMADGGFVIWDGWQKRLTIYDARGELRSSHGVDAGLFGADAFQVDRTGNLYLKAASKPWLQPSDIALQPDLVWIHVDTGGSVIDSIPIPTDASPAVPLYGGPDLIRLPPLLTTLGPLGEQITGAPQEYAFVVQRRGERPLRVVREHQPVALTRAERQEWTAVAEHESKQPIGVMFRTIDGQQRRDPGPTVKFAVPPVKPAFKALRTDGEGRVWVRRYVAGVRTELPPRPVRADARPASAWREPLTYDVFEPTGRFLGTIVMPDRTTLAFTRGLQVWAIARGDLDEPYIARYRIEPVGGR
jgi:hypothetical protein